MGYASGYAFQNIAEHLEDDAYREYFFGYNMKA